MMRSMMVMVLLSGGLATGVATADSARPEVRPGPAGLIVGESFSAARAKLLKNGWQPTRRHANDGYEYSGAELQLTRRKIFEVDACSSDSARCILFYAKKGACLRIDAIGERFADMTVTRWVNECPGAPPTLK